MATQKAYKHFRITIPNAILLLCQEKLGYAPPNGRGAKKTGELSLQGMISQWAEPCYNHILKTNPPVESLIESDDLVMKKNVKNAKIRLAPSVHKTMTDLAQHYDTILARVPAIILRFALKQQDSSYDATIPDIIHKPQQDQLTPVNQSMEAYHDIATPVITNGIPVGRTLDLQVGMRVHITGVKLGVSNG